ncbi:leukotriene A-4 hydrolase [Maniola hyperantus]|uniref:leukotriene A-4 hydrolase n=1 Tax=Aphantopus hyperantus TaxID=2795564 RepID=UPI00156961C1|nr:leukotriene A-4 hydrolase [Maniola hyperantus]
MSVIGKVVTRHFRFPFRHSIFTRLQGAYSVFTRKLRFENIFTFTPGKGIQKVPSIDNRSYCLYNAEKAMAALSPLDPSSFSRPEFAIIKHIDLTYDVDFEKKVLYGTALYNIQVLDYIDDLILDTRDLTIEKLELDDGTPLRYNIDDAVPNLGSKLTITLPQSAAPEQKLQIRIKYSSAPTATALQWLEANQTAGKVHPYMFSQCQPIHARSILPCQDTPAVKFTYQAKVTAPAEFTVLMSAIRGEVANNITSFNQPVPIPSYLLAIAAGVLESRKLGPRSRVWSEAEEITQSTWEFADTEKYLQAAEKMCGPYQWTQYDLLVLPPSFPYGGMENPCLTFVTPTLLAGDRSQADVIIHEIMHSWTGNLVTNRNFEHFWLNEGFTVYLERKVAASLIRDPLEARQSRDFESILGLQELKETIYNELGVNNSFTSLVIKLDGFSPDDAFSRVPYEKGSLFLRYLEDLVGGANVFDPFLRSYLDKFQRQSIDTYQFKDYLLDYFKDNKEMSRVDWDTWLFKTGMPPIIPDYDTTSAKEVKQVVDKIKNEPDSQLAYNDVTAFSPHQIINLLQSLIEQDPLPLDKLQNMGLKYKICTSKNSEIEFRWLRLCIRSKDKTKLDDAFSFVNSQGRMKYVRPLYRDLYAWEEVRESTIENFQQNEPFMMHVSAHMLKKDLHLVE